MTPPSSPVRDRARVTACLEFMGIEEWARHNPERVQQHLSHWYNQIQSRAQQLGGEAQQVQPHIIWLGFSHIETLPALKACMRLCVPLLKKPLYLDGNPVPLRIGVDVEGQTRNEAGEYETPFPSDPFFIRGHAQSGECVIQGDLVGLLPPSLPTERLTHHLGNELDPEISCYRLILDKPQYQQTQPSQPSQAQSDQPDMKPAASPEPVSSVKQQVTPEPRTIAHAHQVNAMQESSVSSVTAASRSDVPDGSSRQQQDSQAPNTAQLSDDSTAKDLFRNTIAQQVTSQVSNESPVKLSQPVAEQRLPVHQPAEAPALSRPATAPVIPEVVSQRHSVHLPQEPESTPLPLFAMDGSARSPQTAVPQAQDQPSHKPQSRVSSTASPDPQSFTSPSQMQPATMPEAEAYALSLSLPDYIASVTTPPIPNQSIESALDALVDFLTPALQPGAVGRLASVSGLSGVGKSVLLNHSLLQKLIPDPSNPSVIWFSAACDTDYPAPELPLSFWTQLVQNSIPLGREGGDSEQLSQWLEQSLAPVFGDDWTTSVEDVFQTILAIPRLDDWEPSLPAQQHDRLVDTLYQFLTRMANTMPMVVVMDDVDQMDTASQDVWLKLLKRGLTQAAPISLVFSHGMDTHFTGDLGQWLETAKAQGRYMPVIIEPLTTHHVLNMLGDDGPFAGLETILTPSLSQQLLDRVKGDFLSVSEYVSYLHALQVFAPDPQTGKLMSNPKLDQGKIQLPPDRHTLLSMRWEHLPADDQHGLEVAAMLGDKLSIPLWKATVELSERQQKEVLQRLAAYQWLMTDMETGAQFRHPSFRQFILKQIPVDIQQAYAEQIYAHYRSLHDNNQTIQPLWLAVYADWANMPNEALEAWLATASQASQLGNLAFINVAWNQVFARLDALTERGALTREQQQLLQQLTGIQEGLAAYNLTSHPEITAEILPKVVTRYREQNQLAPMVGALSYLTVANDRIGHVQGALEALDQAISHVPEHQYPHESLLLKADRLVCLYKLGRYGELKQTLDTGIIQSLQQRLAELGEHARATDWAVFHRARWVKMAALWREGQPQSAERIEALLHEMKRSANSTLQCNWPCTLRVQLELVQYLSYCGEYATCKTQLHDALQQIEQLPHNEGLVAEWGRTALFVYIDQLQWDNANDLILHSLHQAEAAKEYRTWVLINVAAGRIALAEERYTDAASIFESMATESAQRHMAECALLSWRYLAEAQARLGQGDKARDVLEKALAVAQKPEISNALEEFRLSVALAQLHMAQGQLKAGGSLLQGIWPRLIKTTFSPLIAEAAEVITHLYTTIANSTSDATQREQHQAKADEFARIASEHRAALNALS